MGGDISNLDWFIDCKLLISLIKMFSNRLHNLYQKTFISTPDHLQQSIEDAHLGLDICLKYLGELQEQLARR